MHLLAVSAGGGLMVGVGIRWAENRRPEVSPDRSVSRDQSRPDQFRNDSADRLAPFLARLESLESRIAEYKHRSCSETKTVEVDRTSSLDEISEQIAAMERTLRQELERRHRARIDQLSEALERSLTQRISPLEAEIEKQRTAVGELRDFSLRTETSVQKLIEGIEKLAVSQAASQAASQATAKPVETLRS
jgi:hypothetical protein